ncbi:AraC-like ligand-binding domain-containing protein [Streptomyces humidus]|uniref:AraC-like ligand-binding domain-containing protein n=1 Tax=Streptomyces humidus TaxID=52259 RepID=UPI003325BFA7
MSTMTTPLDETAAGRFDFWHTLIGRSFVPLAALPRETPDFHASLCSAQVGAVQVSVVDADPHAVAHTRRHISSGLPEMMKVSVQLAGQCVLTQKDREVLLRPGELALYDTRFPYTLDFDHPYRVLVLMFPLPMLRLPDRELDRLTAVPVPSRTGLGPVVVPFLKGLAEQVEELEAATPPRLAETVVDLVGALVASGAAPGHDGPCSEREPLTRRILAYMEQRLADPRLGPDHVAAAHHISRRYLYNLLADQGHTVSGWIRERRLEQCHRDLTDPALDALPVGAVGGRWGFPDPARFSHAFKAAYGMSPSQARSTAQALRQ